VLTFRALDPDAVLALLARAEAVTAPLPLDAEAAVLVRMADGDGRAALTLAEEVWRAARAASCWMPRPCNLPSAPRAVYDRDRDGHYGLISALHKAVRGSDPDAACYWFCRMVDGGEDRASSRGASYA
jgi:putative ATPase